MAQVTRTVNDLINRAFYLIGEYGEDYTVEGTDFDFALDTLNLIIDHFSSSASYIPITEAISFTMTPGQQDYVFSNVAGITPDVVSNRIAGLEYCDIVLQQFFWPVRIVTRTQIYTNNYNLTAQFRPAYVMLVQNVEKSTLRFFPAPDQAYRCDMQAKFFINKFEKNQPLRNVPLSLQDFFVYALGKQLTSYYPSANWNTNAQERYAELKADLLNTNDIDLSIRQSNLLRYPYQDYNGTIQNILGG